MNILQYIRLFFATKEEVAFNESTTNKTISINSSSTDTQYSSAKSVWNIINNHSSLHELKDLITDNTHQTVTASQKTTWDSKQNAIIDLDNIRDGAELGATSLQSGSNISTLNNDSGYLKGSDVQNNVTSTETAKPLSANMGKELQNQIDNLTARGRFLALWNCATGLPNSNPTTSPYSYKTGDYYVIGNISSSTNYKPNGSTYTTDVASSTVESNTVAIDDVYYYDGSNWRLQVNTQKTISFSNIGGSPSDNTELASALNSKATGTTVNEIDATASESVQKASIPSVYAVIQYIESLDATEEEF